MRGYPLLFIVLICENAGQYGGPCFFHQAHGLHLRELPRYGKLRKVYDLFLDLGRCLLLRRCLFMGNGQKREYLVLFWPRTDVPQHNSGRVLLAVSDWPTPTISRFWPKTTGYSVLPVIIATLLSFHPFLAILCLLSGGLLDCSNGSTWATRIFFSKLTAAFRPGDVEIDNIFPLFFNNFGANPPVCLGDTPPAQTTTYM